MIQLICIIIVTLNLFIAITKANLAAVFGWMSTLTFMTTTFIMYSQIEMMSNKMFEKYGVTLLDLLK